MDILIIDEKKSIPSSSFSVLENDGHHLETAEDHSRALMRINEKDFGLVFLNSNPGMDDGLDLLRQIIAVKPRQIVTILTNHASSPDPAKAARLQPFGYLENPLTPEQLRALAGRAMKSLEAPNEMLRLQETLCEPESSVSQNSLPPRFISEDPKTREEFNVLFRAAATSASILILGESGTGKSVMAREIHNRSHLRNKPFVTISCRNPSKELLESELFGHVRDSFPGATKDSWGKVHAAEGGTLFLDDVGSLPLETQPKLLRLLEEREYERIGENQIRGTNVRIIAATNQNIRASATNGGFREDLFDRLNVISVTIPPLRERSGDLEKFAIGYLGFFAAQLGRNLEGISESGLAALRRHPWPGNLRELRNAIERATILASGPKLEAADLPPPARPSNGAIHEEPQPGIGGKHSLEEIEQAHMKKVLRWAGSLHQAASVLGIDKATLYRKRKRFGIS